MGVRYLICESFRPTLHYNMGSHRQDQPSTTLDDLKYRWTKHKTMIMATMYRAEIPLNTRMAQRGAKHLVSMLKSPHGKHVSYLYAYSINIGDQDLKSMTRRNEYGTTYFKSHLMLEQHFKYFLNPTGVCSCDFFNSFARKRVTTLNVKTRS